MKDAKQNKVETFTKKYSDILNINVKLSNEIRTLESNISEYLKKIEDLEFKLIVAAEYGYNLRNSTSFPEKDFNSNGLNNFLQKLSSEGFSHDRLTLMKDRFKMQYESAGCDCDFCKTYDKYKWATISECGCACHTSSTGLVGHEGLCCEYPNGKKEYNPYSNLLPATEYYIELNS